MPMQPGIPVALLTGGLLAIAASQLAGQQPVRTRDGAPRLPARSDGTPPSSVVAIVQGAIVQLSWNCAEGAVRYDVMAGHDPGSVRRIASVTVPCTRYIDPATLATVQQARTEGRAPPLPSPSTTEQPVMNRYAHDGVPLGSRVTYIIRAVYPDGAADSDPVVVETPLPAPRSLSATMVGSDGAELRWAAVPGATGYRITRWNARLRSFDSSATPGCIAETRHVDHGLSPARYSYSVEACPAGIPAHASVTITETIPQEPRPAPSAGAVLYAGGTGPPPPATSATRREGQFVEVRAQIKSIGESLKGPGGTYVARIVSGPRPYVARFERAGGAHAADATYFVGPTSDMGGVAFCPGDGAAVVVSGNGEALGVAADHAFTVVSLASSPARLHTLSAQAYKSNGFFTPRIFFSPDCTLVLTAIANVGGSSNYVLQVTDMTSGRKIGTDVDLDEFDAAFSAFVITVSGRSNVEIRTGQQTVRIAL
jgi:hypothetical protein